jgi:hypothetical protein
MVISGEGRYKTVRNAERRECHDDGLWVTLVKDGNGNKIIIFTVYKKHDEILIFGKEIKFGLKCFF